MCLPKTGLFRQSEPSQFSLADPVEKCFAEIVLEASELHESSIAASYTFANRILASLSNIATCKSVESGLFHNENPCLPSCTIQISPPTATDARRYRASLTAV